MSNVTEEGVLTCCGYPMFWVDCDQHEPESEGCYMALCEICDKYDRDCEGTYGYNNNNR